MSVSYSEILEALPYLTPEETAELDALIASEPEDVEFWREERAICRRDRAYFLDTYVQIYDNESEAWVPFRLWPGQRPALELLASSRQAVILKARQVGLSWLCLGEILHATQFEPIQTANVFSLRETDAMYLIGDERLKGMWSRMPAPLRSELTTDSAKHLAFANGSHVRAFPTSAGDSYAATIALVDEADLVPDLNRLLRRVKPSVDAGGRLRLISRSNKDLPVSEFKRIYQAAKRGKTSWRALFLPWQVRPGRTPEWYAAECADALANTGSLDDVHEQYPATDTEALAPRSLDKRYPAAWLEACYEEREPVAVPSAPAYSELRVYVPPAEGRRYVLGCDPSEGLPGGDAASLHVLDRETGEECAMLAGVYEPKRAFPRAIFDVAAYYNGADVLVERNNHGHAVIAGLEALGARVLAGKDDRAGWLTSTLGKTIMCDTAADAFKNGETRLHSFSTYTELASIERGSLSAPKNLHDDEATSYALALAARALQSRSRKAHQT